jgi:hypothetical protein
MAGIRTRRCSYSSRFSRRLGWRWQCIYQRRTNCNPKRILWFTAKLFTWRKAKQLFILEKWRTTFQRTMYAYFRYNNNETVMVLINNSNETKTIKPIDSKKTLRTSKQEKMLFLNLHLTYKRNNNRT